jgi:hypothetical protein
LPDNETGDNNTAVGNGALFTNTAGSGNTALGTDALLLATASSNVGLGFEAGNDVTTGANNTLVGTGVDVSAGARTGSIAIGRSSAGVSASATVDNGLFFHTSLDDLALAVAVTYDAATGQMGPVTSSRRWKENIEDLAPELSARLWDLRPVAYNKIAKPGQPAPPREFGLIAEEVAEVIPEIVPCDKTGPYGVVYDRLVVLLLAELKLLRGRVAALEAQCSTIAP